MTTVLAAGLHLWPWVQGAGPDPIALARDCRAVGAVGLVVHAVGDARPALRWIDAAKGALEGLSLAVAIGSRGPAKWRTALAEPCVRALDAGYHVVLDAEGAWDHDDGSAQRVVDHVLAAVPDAVGRVADAPWWAPRSLPGGGATHPGFPTAAFGRLCATRYPQCYGATTGDGASGRMLAWARHPSQYPACGSPASAVYPTLQGYGRSPHDVCALALAEPHALVWLGSAPTPNALTPDVRRGLVAARSIAVAGHTSIAAWQAAAGLTADGILGPRSLAALGL